VGVVDTLVQGWSATEEITNKCQNMCHANVMKCECYSFKANGSVLCSKESQCTTV